MFCGVNRQFRAQPVDNRLAKSGFSTHQEEQAGSTPRLPSPSKIAAPARSSAT